MDGVLVLDKPASFTSHDAVQKARRILGISRIGHLGTLDPLATGVLPLVVGRATRLAQFFRNRDKVYEGVMRWGFSTDTYDRTGTPTSADDPVEVTRADVEVAFRELTGDFEQVPPAISAKKIGGVEAYKLARRHVAVELPPMQVHVEEFSLLGWDSPRARFRVHCSGGTYVRSLVHDAGRRLGCGAHVEELRRLASGEFRVEHAVTLDRLAELCGEDRASEALVPAEQLLPEFPVYRLPPMVVGSVLSGRDFRTFPPLVAPYIKVISPEGRLLAIAERGQLGFFHPAIVL